MKILIFTHVFPYPLTEGGKVAQFGIIKYLCRDNKVILVNNGNYVGIENHVAQLQKALPYLKIILNKNPPQPNTDKGIAATVLDKFNKLQWRLEKAINKNRKPDTSIINNQFFVYPVRPVNAEAINDLIEILEIEKPDVVQVDFIDNADIINLLPKNTVKVLVHHDLRFASMEQACYLQKETKQYAHYLSAYVQTIETAFLNKFDAVITFSNEDKNKLKPLLTKPLIEAIPYAINQVNTLTYTDDLYSIEKLVFVGPHYHAPNFDAVQWYSEELAAIIYEKFKLKLLVIGDWSAMAKQHFANFKEIEFSGFVPDLQAATKNSIMIAPLRIGSGIRTKLLAAFASGVPVISSSVGCEGLGVENDKQLLIANSPDEFVQAVKKLTDSSELVATLRSNANKLITQKYSPEVVGKKRVELYEVLLDQKKSVAAV